MNLANAFATVARNTPDKTAVFWGDASWTYQRILDQSGWVSQELRTTFAIREGAPVALWLKNCPEFLPALLGILQAGAVTVPINNFLKPAEVAYILDDSDTDVLITDRSMAEAVTALQAARPSLRVLWVDAIPEHGLAAALPPCGRASSDLAVIIYTSGTTGRPKGAMLSHGNLLHNVESCRQVLQAAGNDRFVVALPMFHSFMLCVGLLLPLLIGGSIVLVKSLHPPHKLIEEIVHHQATLLPAIPQLFRSLCHPSVPSDLPLRVCISGGAPLPGEILAEFSRKFSIPLLEGYGLSETSPVATFNPLHAPRAGSIGLPIPNVEVSIQDDAGQLLPHGQTGEVCVRGGNVMQGYWRQPGETAKVMRHGWLLTGDIGHQDADGYFYITDRKKDMLLVNGINVYPREIEEILYRFPGVKEAAVIGVLDARRGEQPVAFVSSKEGETLDEKALLHHVREQLADYKVPKKVVLLPALPRNATGKILKTNLREHYRTPA